MATEWKSFLLDVMPDVPGCPIRLAEKAIRDSAIKFCEEGRAWRSKEGEITNVTTAQGTGVYTLSPPTGAEIIGLYYVKKATGNLPLDTIPEAHIKRHRQTPTEQEPRWFNQPRTQEIEFFWTPDDAYEYVVRGFLKPTRDAADCPDFLYNDWREEICHGAKAALMIMPNRDWSAPQLVQFHRREFINGYVESRIRDSKSNVQSSSRARPGYFGVYRNGTGL